MNGGKAPPDWARSYMVLLANQVVTLAVLGLVTSLVLRESYRACEAAELALPALSLWYFRTAGWSTVPLVCLVSLGISVGVFAWRRRMVAVLTVSGSFLACVAFLSLGAFAAIAPLLVAIRNLLPADQRW